jgi:hypothetical protein
MGWGAESQSGRTKTRPRRSAAAGMRTAARALQKSALPAKTAAMIFSVPLLHPAEPDVLLRGRVGMVRASAVYALSL